MNILSHIHIHRIPNPSGVGRVIDQMLTTHARLFPHTRHRMLVARKRYDEVYLNLSDFWRRESFIPHASPTSWQQAKWALFNTPPAEEYWDEVDLVYCPAESYVATEKAKLVCTIHDVAGFEDGLYPNTISRRMHCRKWRILFKKMELNADAIVTVSNFSAERIAHFFPGLAPKLHVIHNAPYHLFSRGTTAALAAEVARLSGGSPYILVPGGLSLRKNADLVLKAAPLLFQALPDVKLVIAGSSTPAYAERLDAINRGNVIPVGYVSDQLLNALYQTASVVWFPSRYEGFGMPVLEAMASGAPVVASNVSSLPEVAADAALLCDIDDPQEHIEAMRSILESERFRDSMIEKSRNHSARFSWESSATALDQLFRSL